MSKKQKIISAIVTLVVAIFGGGAYMMSGAGGGQMTIGPMNIVGIVENYVSLPIAYSDSNTTTTDSALPDGGATLVQLVTVDGIQDVGFHVNALGGTPTSTLCIKPRVSLDGTNYYDVTTTSTATDKTGVVAIGVGDALEFCYDPGTASTTDFFTFNLPATKFVRFQFKGEDVSTDPNDGVQAFIQLGVEQGY